MSKLKSFINKSNANKRAFTLVELLAVIVILAIILAIAVPSISNVISSATRSALSSDAKMVLKKLDYESLASSGFDPRTVNAGNIGTLGLSNDNYNQLKIGLVNSEVYIVIKGKNKWAGLKACGTYDNIIIADETDMTKCENIPITIWSMEPKLSHYPCDPSSLVNFCISEVSLFSFNFTTTSHYKCDGTTLNIVGNEALYSVMGATYGGNGTTNFKVPNLVGTAPLAGLNYFVAKAGLYPSWYDMTPLVTIGDYKYYKYQSAFQNYLLGEIKLAADVNEADNKMLLCDGRTLLINDYPLLYSLIGATYGGNGTTNFKIPNLSAAVPPVDGAKYYIVVSGLYPERP